MRYTKIKHKRVCMKNLKQLRTNESGLAAIMVTVFLLVIISLTVLAFAEISRREQRQTLDRQLSNQAFYVAESGINDATKYLRNPDNLAAIVAADYKKETCSAAPVIAAQLDTSATFQEICVLFDRAPKTLEYSSIDGYRGELLSLQTTTDVPPRSVIVEWNDIDGGQNFGGCEAIASIHNYPTQPTYSNNCDAGILRLSFMPVTNGAISRERLAEDQFTVFLRPTRDTGPGLVNYSRHASSSENEGFVAAADCSSGKCRATIQGLPPANGLFVKVTSIYSNSALTIEGRDASNQNVRFKEAQIKIDSTGKVSDVMRRMQVRIPFYPQEVTPPGFESMNGICKRLDVYSGYGVANDCGGATYFQ